MGLSSPVTSSTATLGLNLQSDNDLFSTFMSSPAPPITYASKTVQSTIPTAALKGNENITSCSNFADNLSKQEAEFFNQSIPNEQEKAKLTKDNILALYGTTPNNSYNKPTVGTGYNNFHTTNTTAPQIMNNQFVQMQHQNFAAASGLIAPHQMQFMPHNPNNMTGTSAVQANNMNIFSLGSNPNLPVSQTPHSQFNYTNQQQPSFGPQIGSFVNFQHQNQTQPPPLSSNNIANIDKKIENMNLGNVWQ